jgi:hypothetical protein
MLHPQRLSNVGLLATCALASTGGSGACAGRGLYSLLNTRLRPPSVGVQTASLMFCTPGCRRWGSAARAARRRASAQRRSYWVSLITVDPAWQHEAAVSQCRLRFCSGLFSSRDKGCAVFSTARCADCAAANSGASCWQAQMCLLNPAAQATMCWTSGRRSASATTLLWRVTQPAVRSATRDPHLTRCAALGSPAAPATAPVSAVV